MGLYKKFAFRGLITGLLIAAAVFSLNVLSTPNPVAAVDTGDCGASSIITCGVTTVDEIIAKYDSDATVRGTYQNFRSASTPNGITREMLVQLKDANMTGPQGLVYDTWTNGVRDVVTKANGSPIANNAMTAGRVNVNGSTAVGTFGGVTAYQHTYQLSNQGTKQMFILMDGNKFVFGVIADCGNPVTADTPNITENKEISKDNVSFSENTTFKDGETAYFRITVHETSGKTGASNVMVTDALPAGFSIVTGSTKLNGSAIADVSSDPINIGVLSANATSTVTFQATAHIVGQSCGTSHIVNTAAVSSDQSNPISDTASGDVTKDCPVVSTCKSLSGPDSLSAGEQGTYSVAGTAENTTITGYIFNLDGTDVQNSASDTYTYTASPGDHTLKVSVVFANGDVKTDAANCTKQIKVNELPKYVICTGIEGPGGLKVGEAVTFTALTDNDDRVASYTWEGVTTSNGKTATASFDKDGSYTVKVTIMPKTGVNGGMPVTCEKAVTVTSSPLYSCDLLKLDPQAVKVGQKVRATVTFTAKNGAAFKSAIVNFGEASVGADSAAGNSFTADYTYKTAKTYDVTATITFTVNGETVLAGTDCAAKITVTATPPAVLGAATTKLANTGPEGILGIFVLTTFIGTAFHYRYFARRPY